MTAKEVRYNWIAHGSLILSLVLYGLSVHKQWVINDYKLNNPLSATGIAHADEVEKRVDSVEKTVDGFTRQIAIIDSKIDVISREVSNLKSEISGVEDGFENLEKKWDIKFEKIDDRFDDIRQTIWKAAYGGNRGSVNPTVNP